LADEPGQEFFGTESSVDSNISSTNDITILARSDGSVPAGDLEPARNNVIPLQFRSKNSYLESLARIPERAVVSGKFFCQGAERFTVKGTTYGTFEPLPSGELFPPERVVRQDFEAMAEAGINSVRVYTVPPRWLLDIALENSLMVLVGIPWNQHLAFLDDTDTVREIEDTCRKAARACINHPAVLAYSLGNEIRANIVRWLGARRVERFLKRLYTILKNEDPGCLVTYVNFPTTEYLNLDFLDFISFNVYLETLESLESYLTRLQTLAGDKPLLLAEVGLDSLRNGEQSQADTLDWQLKTVFETGCAGTFVYAWTDDWYTEGHAIEDWDFGLTTRDRQPKPALDVVSERFRKAPFDPDDEWPRMSVVICSYNGSATIEESLRKVLDIDYPDYEVIVVDDGSTDGTALVAEQLGVPVIRTSNRGLSNARNTGYRQAKGDIVVYLDDDAYPDPHWLRYLSIIFRDDKVGAAGGPNLAPSGDGLVADCVANAPGSPMEVLLSDCRAEHIPGCNMAIRRQLLIDLGGFDGRFRAAGDDVDMCWRILDSGAEIGFHPAAFNWHHRRDSLRTYYSQQKGYGKAEALLADKWPQKYNEAGHIRWRGCLYGSGVSKPLTLLPAKIYAGVWGSASFQRLYSPGQPGIATLLMLPELYLVLAVVFPLAVLGFLVSSLSIFQALFLGIAGLLVFQALNNGLRVKRSRKILSLPQRIKRRLLISWLHLVQPLLRLKGRLFYGLFPGATKLHSNRALHWRFLRPVYNGEIWEGRNVNPLLRLSSLEQRLQSNGFHPVNGGNFSDWDMQLQVIPFVAARLRLMVEEHGEQVELVRYRLLPVLTGNGLRALGATCCVCMLLLFLDPADNTFSIVVALSVLVVWLLAGATKAMAAFDAALHDESRDESQDEYHDDSQDEYGAAA